MLEQSVYLAKLTRQSARVENRGVVFDFLGGGGGIVESKNGVKAMFLSFQANSGGDCVQLMYLFLKKDDSTLD